jgi:hypothetical protein
MSSPIGGIKLKTKDTPAFWSCNQQIIYSKASHRIYIGCLRFFLNIYLPDSLGQGVAVNFQVDAVLVLGVVGGHLEPTAAPRFGLLIHDGCLRCGGGCALPFDAALLGADKHAGKGGVAPRQLVPSQRQVVGHALHYRRTHLSNADKNN